MYRTIHKHIRQRKNTISSFHITILLRQLSTLISADIPLIKCFDILEKSQKENSVRLLIYRIKYSLLSGNNLFDSFKQHPHYFNDFTCQLVQIGEQTGKLNSILNRIANYYEHHQALKRQIIQALFYPTIITLGAIIITLGMLVFVIPRFAELFNDTDINLPFITRAIFYSSNLIRQYFWLIILGISIIGFSLLKYHFFKKNSFAKNGIYYIPVIKSYLEKTTLINFSRHLALAISSGFSITQALNLAKNVCTHPLFTATFIQLNQKINAGYELNMAMRALPLFPILMIQLVQIGEESGTLENMLNKFADLTETEVNQFIQKINQLLEPLIMVVLGVLIGGLVLGMYLPIFKLGNAL